MKHLNQVQYNLIKQLKTAFPVFGERVVLTTDTDYQETTVSGQVAKQEALPIMYLIGPEMLRNDIFTTHEKPTFLHGPEVSPGGPPSQFTRHTAEEAIDLYYQIVILDNHLSRWTDLMTAVHGYFLNGKFVEAEKTPGEPDKGVISYEIDLVDKFKSGRIVNRSNLKETTGRIIVRGVLISDGQVFEEGFVAEDVRLTAVNR